MQEINRLKAIVSAKDTPIQHQQADELVTIKIEPGESRSSSDGLKRESGSESDGSVMVWET